MDGHTQNRLKRRARAAEARDEGELIYDAWHLAFANLVQRRGPPNVDVQTEVRLTIEPQRADMLLLRRRGEARRDSKARMLRGLWRRLGRVTVLEYKSPVDASFRPGDLLRLFGYGVLYHTGHLDDLPRRRDLTLALVLPAITPTLRDEIDLMGWTLADLGHGYGRIDGAEYAIYVAAIDEVSEAEKDEFLTAFSRRRMRQGKATRWLEQWLKEDTMKRRSKREMPGYHEMFLKLVEALPPEERLAGMSPEERMAGLPPEQTVLALPPEILRQLPSELVSSLPADVQKEVKKRLRRARAA